MIEALLLSLLTSVQAAELDFPRNVTQWQAVTPPHESDKGAKMVWFHAANYAEIEWRVSAQDAQVRAEPTKELPAKPAPRPKFVPKAERFARALAFSRVNDGWLVGFNEGEFGAALYWFSSDGKRSYRISDHQVVDFISGPQEILAIEGLAHLSISKGSLIRITRPNPHEHWKAVTLVKLPFAPYAVSRQRDGTLLITLSDALVAVSSNYRIDTLLSPADWGGLYPNSSVLSSDERKLYIGMRQFVGEFDLDTKQFRFLIPSERFLNKLPKEDEERIRKQYGG